MEPSRVTFIAASASVGVARPRMYLLVQDNLFNVRVLDRDQAVGRAFLAAGQAPLVAGQVAGLTLQMPEARRAFATFRDPGDLPSPFSMPYPDACRVLGSMFPPWTGGHPAPLAVKVVESQANIKCESLNTYLDGATVIAEWEAEFDDVVQGVRRRMREPGFHR